MARIMVPFDGSPASERALAFACRTATDAADAVEAIGVVRIPLQLPMDADLPDARLQAEEMLARAEALATSYHRCIKTTLVLARGVGPGVVAAAQGADLLVVGDRSGRLIKRLLGRRTLRYVVAHAPCPVLVVSIPPTTRGRATDTVFHLAQPGIPDEMPGQALVAPLSPSAEPVRHGS